MSSIDINAACTADGYKARRETMENARRLVPDFATYPYLGLRHKQKVPLTLKRSSIDWAQASRKSSDASPITSACNYAMIIFSCFLGPGGADAGRVVTSNRGSTFPFGRLGITSSRFTGIPNEIKYCLRIRDRIQLGGRGIGGGDVSRFWYNARLIPYQQCLL